MVRLPSFLCAAALFALGCQGPAAAAVEVGVSIAIAQPGVYGRVDIGRFPQPMVIVDRPVWAALPERVRRPPEPVYLWVPPGHRKRWERHCQRYGACGVPVYFVDDGWYRRHVLADGGRGPGRGKGR